MKKLFVLIIFIIIVISISYLVKANIGNPLPVILPPRPLPASEKVTLSPQKSPQQTVESVVPANLPLSLPEGFTLGIFSQGLDKVRDLQLSPGGTLLASIISRGEIIALPDQNNDGRVDKVKIILKNLNNPHGLAFYQGKLFVAEETSVSRYSWNEQELTADKEKKLFDLPSGGRHFTRSLAFNEKGQLFVSVGSTCDVCYENNPFLAAVIVSDSEGKTPRLIAKGLRNTVFLKINPQTEDLWGADMGRDYLGDNIPPDEINIIKDGKDYGWPICYGDRIHDGQFDKKQYITDPCLATQPPIYNIPAHSAPLGLLFVTSKQFPDSWQNDLLVSYHGSWNRSVPTGYKIVRLQIQNDKIIKAEDFISGFLQGNQAFGRPVDLEFDKQGSLFISDDKAGRVYKIVYNK